MHYREIAQTGIKVSPLGLGTVKFGRNQGMKYPQAFDLPDDKQVRELLALSHDLGINLLDTAPAYGLSEQRLGQLISNRHDWVIETKVGEDFKEGVSRFDFTAEGTQHSIERSLRLLKTDYLDMVLIHSDGDDQRILQQEAVLSQLIDLRQAGKVRAIGISSKTVEGGLLAFKQDCDVVMSCYNPIYSDELPLLQAAVQQKRGILIKKAFASGHLEQFCAIRSPHNTPSDTAAPANPIEIALRFIFAQAGVSSIILGTINPAHLRENIALTEKISVSIRRLIYTLLLYGFVPLALLRLLIRSYKNPLLRRHWRQRFGFISYPEQAYLEQIQPTQSKGRRLFAYMRSRSGKPWEQKP